MRFETHKEIDDYYRKQGVDVDKLNRELKETGLILDKAIKNVRGRWGFFKRLFTPTFKGLGRMHPEIHKEFAKLQDGEKK